MSGPIRPLSLDVSFVEFMRRTQELMRRGRARSRQAAKAREEVGSIAITYGRETERAQPGKSIDG